MRKVTIALVWLVTTLASVAQAGPSYKLSMLPRYSPEEIIARITPLAQHLSKVLGTAVEPVVASDFKEYERRLKSGDIHIGYENPYIYALVSNAHEVLAMASKGPQGVRFRGIIITRAGSNIVAMEDLRGKTVEIVGYTSAGGYLSQRVSLLDHGLDTARDMRMVEALDNKQENVIFSVYQGDADAGFIRESALNIVDKYIPPSQIKVIQRTAWLPNWALSVSRSMPKQDRDKIAQALQGYKEDGAVLRALKIERFEPADDGSYDVIRKAAGLPPAGS